MISRYQVSLSQPLTGFKLHPATPTEEQSGRPHWLVGVRDHMREVEAERQHLAALSQAVSGAVQGIGPMVEQNLQGVVALATELGLAIAREVVGDAVDMGRVDPSPVVARCLRQMVEIDEAARIRIELHPEDVDLVRSKLQAFAELQSQVAGAEFVANARLPRAGVEVSSTSGRLLYQPAEVVQRMSDEVRQELCG